MVFNVVALLVAGGLTIIAVNVMQRMIMRGYITQNIRTGRRPPVPPLTIRVVKYPADGNAPHILRLRSTAEGIENSMFGFLGHVPDFRRFWGNRVTSAHRCALRVVVKDQSPLAINGIYYLFYIRPVLGDILNFNKPNCLTETITGDAFLVKVKDVQTRADGSADFDIIPQQILKYRPLMVS